MREKEKHAYLIMAHNNFYVLEKLLLLLDDIRNDIYLHIDKKVRDFDFVYFKKLLHFSELIYVDRIDVRWASITQVKAEYLLMRTAAQKHYSYYHLLSGCDMPLKTQNYIHDFCKKYEGKEFIGFYRGNWDKSRCTRIHIGIKYFRSSYKWMFLVQQFFLWVQKLAGYNSWKNNLELQKGANWVSLTHMGVSFLLNNEKEVLRWFHFAMYPDECYKQTLIFNSDFRSNIFNIEDEYKSCMRYIDWQRGNPYVFRNEDYETLIHSDYLFARKFDDTIDRNIVDRLFGALYHNNI